MYTNRVQIAGAISYPTTHVNANSSAPVSVSQAFPSNNTAGNTILVLVSGQANFDSAGGAIASPTISDTQGNTYAQFAWEGNAVFGGGSIGLYVASNIKAGANTVTFGFTGQCNAAVDNYFDAGITVIEYSGMPSPTAQSGQARGIFGGAGSGAQTFTFTDSKSASVTVTMGAPGTISAVLMCDIATGIGNFIVCGCKTTGSSQSLPTTTPSGYQTFTQARQTARSDNGEYLYFWDSANPVLTVQARGNIDWDQIGTDARHGGTWGTKVQYSDGTHTLGNLPKFLNDGTFTDSGIPCPTTPISTIDTDVGVAVNGTVIASQGTSYASLILSESGLAAYYQMQDASGTSIADSKGTNTGTATGSAASYSWQQASLPGLGNCIQMTGAAYFSVPRSIQDDFSIEFWFKTSTNGGSGSLYYQGTALVDAEVSGVTNDFGISYSGAGQLNAGTGNPDYSMNYGALADGNWHHVVMTRQKSTGNAWLYVDGVQVATATGKSTASLTAPGSIGLGGQGAGNYTGYMCHVALYTSMLSATQVAAHSAAGRRIVNLSSTTPAAPSGNVDIAFQKDAQNNISGYVPIGTTSTPGVVKADGTTIIVDSAGKISSVGGGSSATGGTGIAILGMATFNGTGGVASLNALGVVASVTRLGTGHYQINLSSTLTANYAVTAIASDDNTQAMSAYVAGSAVGATSFSIYTYGIPGGLSGAPRDAGYVAITIVASGATNTAPISLTQSDVTASRALETIYQNTSGSPMFVSASMDRSTTGTAFAYCDSSSSPTTPVAKISASGGFAETLFFSVPPGYYYKVHQDTSASLDKWIEYTLTGGGGNKTTLGTFAAFIASPPAAVAGDTYKCSDSPYQFIYTGSVWQAFYQGDAVSLPSSSGWTWENQGTSAADFTYGFLNLQYPGGSAGSWRNYYRAAPSTPYTITVRIRKINWSGATSNATPDGFGLLFRDASGKLIQYYCLTQATNQGLGIEKWSSFSSFSASYNSLFANGVFNGASQFAMAREVWLRMKDDGTNLIWSWSLDGLYWYQFDSRSRTDFFASGPTQVGIGLRNSTSEGAVVDIFGWTVS